jgi:hypothetical protein
LREPDFETLNPDRYTDNGFDYKIFQDVRAKKPEVSGPYWLRAS